MSEFTPVLIHDDTHKRDVVSTVWNQAKSRLQDIVDFYVTLGLAALQPNELSSLFLDTDSLMFDKITGGSFVINDVPINRAKALEIIEKPAGYSTLVDMIATLRHDAISSRFATDGANSVAFHLESIPTLFVLDENGDVQFSTTQQAFIDNSGKIFARNAKQKAMWDFTQAALDKFYELGLDEHFSYLLRDNQVNPLVDIIYRTTKGIDKVNQKPILADRFTNE